MGRFAGPRLAARFRGQCSAVIGCRPSLTGSPPALRDCQQPATDHPWTPNVNQPVKFRWPRIERCAAFLLVARMSTWVLAACWLLQMPPTPKAVLISLADNANDDGYCWPSMRTIALRTCFSERAVQRAIQWLEGAGLIVANRDNGRHTTYTITVKPTSQSHPRQRVTGDNAAETTARKSPHPRQRVVKPPSEVPSNLQEPTYNLQEPTATADLKKAESQKRAQAALAECTAMLKGDRRSPPTAVMDEST